MSRTTQANGSSGRRRFSPYLPSAPGLARLNVLVSFRPWRLLELSANRFLSPLVRRHTQAMEQVQWTSAVPVVQTTPPADLAAHILGDLLDGVAAANPGSALAVVDFSSGPHPPTPFVEHLVNWRRARRKVPPAEFVLSDARPALDDWIPLAEASAHLSFIPQPVDPAAPPIAAVSDRFRTRDGDSSGARVVRLFAAGGFHRLDDARALAALRSALATADAIAVIELVDRRVASLLYVFCEFWFCWLVSLFWFPLRPLQVLLTYPFPVLPFVMAFDRLIACLRWRTFDEMVQLVVAVQADKPLAASKLARPSSISEDYGTRYRRMQVGEWVFEGGRTMHTWPVGYLTYFVGHRIANPQSN